MSSDADALKAVDDFDKDGSANGVFTAIRKEEVVRGLRERIASKDGLNQQNTGLCATASLIHTQLQDDPVSFVALAVGLYKAGQAPWRGMVIKPNPELLPKPPPDGLYDPMTGTNQVFNRADWIVMSSVRYTANPASRIDGLYMKELEAFIRRLGYTKVEADYSENTFSKSEVNARKATKLRNEHYRVILSINAVMLEKGTQAGWGGGSGIGTLWGLAPKPNHNVQLVAGFDIGRVQKDIPIESNTGWPETETHVSFAAFTWAEGHRQVPEDPNKPMQLTDFLWNYYGYIAFKD